MNGRDWFYRSLSFQPGTKKHDLITPRSDREVQKTGIKGGLEWKKNYGGGGIDKAKEGKTFAKT